MSVACSGLLHDFADHKPDLRGGGEHGPELLVQYILEPRSDVVLGEGIGHCDGEGLVVQPYGAHALEPNPHAGDIDPIGRAVEDFLPDPGRLPVGLVRSQIFFLTVRVALSLGRLDRRTARTPVY